MDNYCFKEDLNLVNVPEYAKSTISFNRENPHFFNDVGTMIFCGHQGSGKTLSSVNYIYNLIERYPLMIIVSNTLLSDFPFNCYYKIIDDKAHIYTIATDEEVILDDYKDGRNDLYELSIEYVCIEYDGLDCLKYINNGDYGVVFFIDEIHLELNSLESKNIDIDTIIEISQQRKQRKKIIGTSQVYMRMAKPLREQVFDIVLCNCIDFVLFKLQINKAIDGFSAHEENGKLKAEIKKRSIYFHKYEYYTRYDTYAKMKRYNQQWQGHQRDSSTYFSVLSLNSSGR